MVPGERDGTEDNSPGQQSQWTESLPAMTSHRPWTGPFLLILCSLICNIRGQVRIVGQGLTTRYEKGSVNIPILWVGKPRLQRRQPQPGLVSGTRAQDCPADSHGQ